MAHAYSTDSTERKVIPFFIAGAAIAASYLLYQLMHEYGFELPWWSPSVDTMILYGLFYWIFDQYIWRWKLVHRLRITALPDLSGEWQGRVTPAVGNGGVPTDIRVTIKQTWTGLLVSARTDQSRSHSVAGALTVIDATNLSYQYVNEPGPTAVNTMHAHRGTTSLAFDATNERLEGEYYSGRDRQNIGTLVLTRTRREAA